MSLEKLKEVMKLNGKIVAFSHFILQSSDKCHKFFNILKGCKDFKWMGDCEATFKESKDHLGSPPHLVKHDPCNILQLYLVVLDKAVSSVLTKSEGKMQYLIYFVSKTLLDAKFRYMILEKLILALVTTVWKLKPYFESHIVEVVTSHLIWSVLHKLDLNRRTIAWVA